jgi:hypothetical protein
MPCCLVQKCLSLQFGESSFGFDFPLLNREDVAVKLFNLAATHLEFADKQNRKLHPIPVCFAGPGTGKTRLLREYATFVAEGAAKADNATLGAAVTKGVRLVASFGNGTSFEAATETNGHTALARRILERYFGVAGAPAQATLRDALAAIRDAERRMDAERRGVGAVAAAANDAPLAIVIGVDEVQRLLLDGLVRGMEESVLDFNRRRRVHFGEVTDAIGSVLVAPVEGVLFLPMLAGTASEDGKDTILRGSGHPIKALWPALLPAPSARDLLRAAHLPVDDAAVLTAAADCGGLPRALEYFIEEYKMNAHGCSGPLRSGRALQDAEASLAERYTPPPAEVLEHVIAASLGTTPISRRTKVVPGEALTWGDLEDRGAAFWVGDEGGELAFPAVLLRVYLRGEVSPLAAAAQRVLAYDASRGQWPDWEEFARDFLGLRLVLLEREHGGAACTVRDLLPGAREVGDVSLAFTLPSLVPEPIEGDSQFPITAEDWSAQRGSGRVVLNKSLAPFDVYVSLPGTPPVLVTVECRHSTNGASGDTVPRKEIAAACATAASAWAAAASRGSVDGGERRIVVFFSNRRHGRALPTKAELGGAAACLVMTRDDMPKALPYPLRTRYVCRLAKVAAAVCARTHAHIPTNLFFVRLPRRTRRARRSSSPGAFGLRAWDRLDV